MSPEMVSAITRYETTIRKIVEIGGGSGAGKFGLITVPGGHVVETYRGIPLIKTTATSPITTMSPTITLEGVTTGGSLSDGTYYVQIAPVTVQGEQLASTEQSITLSGGGAAQRIKITLSARHADALYYKVYMATTTLTETLKVIVPALLYASDGTLDLDTADFNGNSDNPFYISSATASAEVPSHMTSDVPFVTSNGIKPESIFLHDLDPIQGLGKFPYANIMTGGVYGGLITTEPLAKVDAYRQFMMYSHMALTPAYEASSYMIRGIRVQ
jgi:hypothetical protein